MVKRYKRFEVYLVNLDPTIGRGEINKARPCVIISPDEMNKNIATIIIAPLTSTLKQYPSRIDTKFQSKLGQVALDQLRSIDKQRLIKKMGNLPELTSKIIALTLMEMFEY